MNTIIPAKDIPVKGSSTKSPLAQRAFTISLSCAITVFLMGCDQSQNERSLLSDEQTTGTQESADNDIALQNSPEFNVASGDELLNTMDEGNEYPLSDRMANGGMAIAEVTPTEGYDANGNVSFAPNKDDTQMDIHIALNGLSPGKHGLHIHQTGDCSAPDASSADGHLNPNDATHGSPQDASHHLGDLGNIEADANGRVETILTVSDLGFSGSSSILQKAIVVHAQEDDLETDPSGESGDRVGCGVIHQNAGELASSN